MSAMRGKSLLSGKRDYTTCEDQFFLMWTSLGDVPFLVASKALICYKVMP